MSNKNNKKPIQNDLVEQEILSLKEQPQSPKQSKENKDKKDNQGIVRLENFKKKDIKGKIGFQRVNVLSLHNIDK